MNMKPAQQQPRPKSNYALFLGDLSIFCSERDIEEAFQTYGEIINVRIQRSKETSRALSYGFVEFSCETAAVTAMNEMNGFVLKGRPLRIRWAAKRNQPVKSENTNPNVATIFVKFASQSGVIVTEELLRSHFSSFGPVYDAAIRTITIDENYNRSKGYGFIQFDNTNGEGTTGAVRASNELHNTTIAGVNYRCEVGYRMSNNNSGKHHGSHSSDAMDSVSGSTMGGHSSQQSASFSSSSKGFLPPISPNGSVVQFQQQQGQGFGSNASVSNYSYSPHSPTSNSPMGGYYSSAASVASVPSISNMSGGAGNGGVVSGPAGQLYHNAVPPAPMYHAAGSPHTHHSGNGAPVTAVVSTISYVPANSYQPQSQGYHYQQPAHAQQQGYYQQPAQYQQQYYPAQNSYHANSGYYASSNSSVSSHPSQNQQQQQYYNQQQQYYAQQAAPHQLPSLPTNESVVQPPAVPVEATAVHQPEQQKAMGRPRRAHLPTGQDALLLAQNLNALNLHQEPAVGGAQRREVRNISGVSNISDITAGTLNDLDDEDEVDGPNSRSADDDLNAADIPAALSEYNALIQSQKKDQSLTTLAPLQTFSDEKSPVNSRPAERRKRQSTSRSTVQSELTADVLYELQKQDQLQQEEDEREELRLRSQQRAPIVSTRRPSAGLKHDADTHLITVKEIAASPIKTRTPSLPGTPTVRGEKLIERGSTASPVVSIAPFTLTSSALAQIQREAEATDSATKSIPERRSKRNSSERSNQSDITAALEYMQEAVEFPEEDDDSAAQLAKLNDSINRCVCGKARSSSSSAPGSPYMSSCPFGTGACSCVYQAMC